MKKFLMAMWCLATIAAAPAHAEDKKAAKPDEAAMKKMMELSTPGEKHKVLEGMIGEWDYTITYKMAADAPEQKSTGTTSNKWILDGRFVESTVTGSMDMGDQSRKFNGIGLIGHDNVKGEYSSIWIDDMSTGIMTTSGKYDAASKTIKESGYMSCPMKGQHTKINGELRFIDDKHYSYTMYDASAKKPFKTMEIQYTKK